jgi:hypothetical protein
VGALLGAPVITASRSLWMTSSWRRSGKRKEEPGKVWKDGRMEYWNTGLTKNSFFFSHYSSIPPFHYSKMNIHLFESGVGR